MTSEHILFKAYSPVNRGHAVAQGSRGFDSLMVSLENSLIPSGRIMALGQGRIKLFAAPRQLKHCCPLFQAVFLSGGVLPPQTVKHHAPQSQDRNNKYFILYIEFCINNKI